MQGGPISLKARIKTFLCTRHELGFGGAREILKYLGPGLLVTVGFIDPGNWAATVAAGAQNGYQLLWMVTLSIIMLILLQHNAAHLGIATGLCLSEAASKHLKPTASRVALGTAVIASVSTALSELLGGAIALEMLVGIPIRIGAGMVLAAVLYVLFSNTYRRLGRPTIGFVSLVVLSFLFELWHVSLDWAHAGRGWVVPTIPHGSIPLIMSVLGTVVMPHNLFLHSEVIQSRQWQLERPEVIERQLKYEFADTLFSMIVGWAINSSMILVAVAVFHRSGVQVTELQEAEQMLRPLLGIAAAVVFAGALLLAGLASSVTAGMAGGSILAGLFDEPYSIKDMHTRAGVWFTLVGAYVAILFVANRFQGLLVSQMLLSVQLPVTIFLQIRLTSSPAVIGRFRNSRTDSILLWTTGLVVSGLNVLLLWSVLRGAG